MLRRFFLLIIGIPIILGFSAKVIACQWDLAPKVLLVNSYQDAQRQDSEDKLIFSKLQEVYGDKVVATVFSEKDDNYYAYLLSNLINRFNIKKVFILDPAFIKYMPKNSSDKIENSNLIRVLEEFTNVDFYFFNNQVADSVKSVANNIYEFRFDVANKQNPTPVLTYGAQLAAHFSNQLINHETGEIDTNKYNFETNDAAQWVIKIGLIKNIGDDYQQQVIDEFVYNLDNNKPLNTIWEIDVIEFKSFSLIHSYDNVQRVQAAASALYQNKRVNFIFNSNDWFNNAIASAASHTAQMPGYTKTIKFIGTNVLDQDAYKYQNINYMLFSSHLNFDILAYTDDETSIPIPTGYEVLDTAPEKINAYGINDDLIFVDGL